MGFFNILIFFVKIKINKKRITRTKGHRKPNFNHAEATSMSVAWRNPNSEKVQQDTTIENNKKTWFTISLGFCIYTIKPKNKAAIHVYSEVRASKFIPSSLRYCFLCILIQFLLNVNFLIKYVLQYFVNIMFFSYYPK